MELENIYFKTKFEEFIFYFDVIAHEYSHEIYEHLKVLVLPIEDEMNETILNLNSKEHISFYLDKLTSELLGRLSQYILRFEGVKNESEKSTGNEYKIHVFFLCIFSVTMVLDTLKRKFYLNNLDFEKVATQIISIREFNTINEFLYPNNNNTQNAILLEPEPPKENEPETPKGKYTAGQKYILLQKLGFFETDVFKGFEIKNEDRQRLLSKLLGVNIRTARGFINEDEKYLPDPENKRIVEKLFNEITKKKTK